MTKFDPKLQAEDFSHVAEGIIQNYKKFKKTFALRSESGLLVRTYGRTFVCPEGTDMAAFKELAAKSWAKKVQELDEDGRIEDYLEPLIFCVNLGDGAFAMMSYLSMYEPREYYRIEDSGLPSPVSERYSFTERMTKGDILKAVSETDKETQHLEITPLRYGYKSVKVSKIIENRENLDRHICDIRDKFIKTNHSVIFFVDDILGQAAAFGFDLPIDYNKSFAVVTVGGVVYFAPMDKLDKYSRNPDLVKKDKP